MRKDIIIKENTPFLFFNYNEKVLVPHSLSALFSSNISHSTKKKLNQENNCCSLHGRGETEIKPNTVQTKRVVAVGPIDPLPGIQ